MWAVPIHDDNSLTFYATRVPKDALRQVSDQAQHSSLAIRRVIKLCMPRFVDPPGWAPSPRSPRHGPVAETPRWRLWCGLARLGVALAGCGGDIGRESFD